MDATQQAAVQAVYTAAGGAALTAAQIAAIGPMVDAGQYTQIADYLSTGLTVQGSVTVPTFLAWAASTGLLAAIEEAAANTASPLYNSALAIRYMLGWPSGSLDLRNSDPVGTGNQQMLADWVSANAITAEQQAALLSLAQQPTTVSLASISTALNAVT